MYRNESLYHGIESQDHCSHSSICPFFLLSLFSMLTLHICVRVFSGIVSPKIMKHSIHFDSELLYRGIENRAHYSFSSLHLSVYLSFYGKFVSQFSQAVWSYNLLTWHTYRDIENQTNCSYLCFVHFLSFQSRFVAHFSQKMCKLQFLNMAFVWKMNVYIVGLRRRLIALSFIFLYFSFYLFVGCLHCRGVSFIFFRKLLKLEFWNLVQIWTVWCWIVGLKNRVHCSFFPLSFFIFLSFKGIFVTVFLGPLKATLFKPDIHMENEWLCCRTETIFFLSYPFFFLSLFLMLTLQSCLTVFSGVIVAWILNLGTLWTKSCCIMGLNNWGHCCEFFHLFARSGSFFLFFCLYKVHVPDIHMENEWLYWSTLS